MKKSNYKNYLVPALVIGGAAVAIWWLRKKQVENLEAAAAQEAAELENEADPVVVPSVEDLNKTGLRDLTTGKKKGDLTTLTTKKTTATKTASSQPTAVVENGIFRFKG